MLANLRRRQKALLLTFLIILGLALVGVGGLRMWYSANLKPVSSSTTTVLFTIDRGNSAQMIAEGLKQAGLIRSVNAFTTYLAANDIRNKLQAGTYKLSPSMSAQTIADKIAKGEVARNLLTILPGKRLDQIKQAFLDAGYSEAEVNAAFDPSNYRGHPVLASLPTGATLEGYLYPESFQKDSNTPAQVIVRQSLDQMQKYLTADVLAGFSAQNLNPFQGITLASIILRETDDANDTPVVSQVLLTRLARDILLQADATAYYASDVAGQPRSLAIESPYNTYQHKGLPPGPISNVTVNALRAAAKPAKNGFLFYVTGDDGKTRFSYTQAEHEENVRKYCHKRCQ